MWFRILGIPGVRAQNVMLHTVGHGFDILIAQDSREAVTIAVIRFNFRIILDPLALGGFAIDGQNPCTT